MEPSRHPSSRPRSARSGEGRYLSALRCQQALDDAPHLHERARRLFNFTQEVSPRSDGLAFKSMQHKDATRQFLTDDIRRWGEDMVASPPDLDPEALFHIMGAYGYLRVHPSLAMKQILLEQAREKFPQMRAFHLRKIPSILADLALYPGDDWMEDWRLEAQKKAGEWDLDHGFHVIYKMAVLDHLRAQDERHDGPSPCRAMASPMMDFVACKSHFLFNGTINSQIHLAGLWFAYDFVKDRMPEAETATVSRAEINLSESFRQAGISSGDVIEITPMGHKVDLSLVFNETAVGCEFDGRYHFVQAPDDGQIHYDGSTRLQTSLIAQHMPPEMRLIRVPGFVMYKIGMTHAWQETLQCLAEQAPGAYVMHGPADIRPATSLQAWAFQHNA